ncbi:YqgE/AlgH family protein [Shewanella sp. GXUN23E]|uniref:YqgE/AlgH family protein n=1 Tax=Shewanella sp. GXUN23E TaxID=3422498 RepID=UPI003D7EAC0E
MQSLTNHFLVAMPSLQDTFFERTVIYMCEHDNKGAMGLIINRPYDIPVTDLLEQMELQSGTISRPEMLEQAVMVGGPVTPERGFVLHTPQANWSNSLRLSDDLMLTTSRDILTSIGTDKAPRHAMVMLGYAGWSKDQLEQELAENSWLTIPASNEIIFHVPFEDRWQQATRALGFDVWQMSHQTGHA